jgi:hypothetical protein
MCTTIGCGFDAEPLFWSVFVGNSCTRMLSGAVRADAVVVGKELGTVVSSGETPGDAVAEIFSGSAGD